MTNNLIHTPEKGQNGDLNTSHQLQSPHPYHQLQLGEWGFYRTKEHVLVSYGQNV